MEKYALVQRLGQGSFAVVWKARRKSDSQLVAVKQLRQSPESWDACKQLPEVRAAAAISDRQNMVQLLEAVRHGGELFMVFEYIESSLHACTAVSQRIEEPQVRWAARRLLAALAAVHQAGLVHCDVKPENILVGTEGGNGGRPTMKLCDFGQATESSRIGTYVGTRWYRPPELLLGSHGDASVDLWAAGCTLAELFLRRPLLPGSDLRDMLFRICGELGAPPDSWPLAAKMVEVSGRANAEAAAWRSLAEAGASEEGVQLIAGLLEYEPPRRLKADRALREAFFAPNALEVAIPVPPARPMSPETLTRQRDEAAVVERRIRRAGSGAPPLSRREEAPPPAQAPRQVGQPGGYAEMPERGPARPPMSRGSTPLEKAATGRGGDVCEAGSESPAPLPRGLRPRATTTPTATEGGGDSDDEALAEMFWGVCKAGTGTPARSPDGTSSGDEALQYVADVADRGRARRARPLEPSGRSGT